MPKTADCAARGGSGICAALFCTVWCLSFPGAMASGGDTPAADVARDDAEFAADTLRGSIQLVEGTASDPSALSNQVQAIRKGTSSASARRAALREMPLDRMSARNRARAEAILREISLFRDLPVLTFEVDPAVYRFFTTYPDVAVSIWRVLRISEFQMWQTGPNEYEADAGDGTVGTIDVLYRGPDEQVILCEGALASPFLSSPIRASSLMHLRSGFAPTADGRHRVSSQLRVFVSFPSQTVETAAKIISPLGNSIIDRNFSEVSLFVYMMSLAMERQPGWVEQLSDRLEGVLEIRKTQLVQLTAQVSAESRRRELARTPGTPQSAMHGAARVYQPGPSGPAAAPSGAAAFPRAASAGETTTRHH